MALRVQIEMREKIVDYPTMSGPAIYRIRVRGYLEANLSDRLEGMRIETLTRGDGKGESVLEGRLMDQAALTGVLNTLYELHLPVMAVDCLAGLDEEGAKAQDVSR
jgi:hypothetical protein